MTDSASTSDGAASDQNVRRARSLVLLVALGTGWGLHISLSKGLGAETTAEALAYFVVYMAGAAIGLCAAVLAFSKPFRVTWPIFRFFVIASFFGYLIPLLTEMIVAPKIDAALFTLIAALSPMLTMAIATAIGQERATRKRLFALALGLAAGAILLAPGVALSREAMTVWVLAAFIAPIAYACDNVYIVWAWPKHLNALQVSAAEAVAGLVLAIIAASAYGVGPAAVATAAQTGGVWLPALVIVSVISTLLFFHLLRTDGAVFVSFAGFVSIATGVLAGIVLFGERPSLGLWTSCALIFGAMWMLRETGSDAKTSAPPPPARPL